MQRGTITILLILSVAVIAATASVFYHYANQRHAQDFWGVQTAALIDKAPKVEVMRLGEVESSPAVSDEDPAEGGNDTPPPNPVAPAEEDAATKALEFNEVPWLVLETRDAAPAKGISNLRRALVLDTTYNWSDVPPSSEPVWQYALGVTDDRDWASVLFDFDSRRVGLAGGRKVVMLHEEAAREFKGFFEEQFAAGAVQPDPVQPEKTEPEKTEPTPEPQPEPVAAP